MIAALALSATLASSPASCEALKSLTLPNTTIVAAEMKAAGPFAQPGAAGRRRRLLPLKAAARRPGRRRAAAPQIAAGALPHHAILRPSPDSEIEIEAWLPRRTGTASSRRRRRRLGRHHQLSGDGDGAAGRLRDGVHRHGSQGRQRALRDRPSGENRRLRLSRGPRDDGAVEGAHRAFYERPARCRTGTAARPADARA